MATKFAPTSDSRNKIISVYDLEGVEHKHTAGNARELVRHLHWTLNLAVALTRRVTPEPLVVKVNDGTPTPPVPVPTVVVETPVIVPWEDLTTLPKDILRKAVQFLKIPDLDGRANERRIVATLDATLDQRLSAGGDFEGAEPLANPADEAAVAAHTNAANSRRRRAYEQAAILAGVPFTAFTTLSTALISIAAQVEDAKE
jgi:hypothetical protein